MEGGFLLALLSGEMGVSTCSTSGEFGSDQGLKKDIIRVTIGCTSCLEESIRVSFESALYCADSVDYLASACGIDDESRGGDSAAVNARV